MKLLAIVQGEYGERHVANIRANAPAGWSLEKWVPPKALPPVIDEPEDFLPAALPAADLLHALFRGHEQVLVLEEDLAGEVTSGRRRDQAQYGEGADGLAAAGFADERERLPRIDAESGAFHGRNQPRLGLKGEGEVGDFQ